MKTIKLSTKEIKLINEACEFYMEQLKEDSTFEISNKDKFYDLWDIRDKIGCRYGVED